MFTARVESSARPVYIEAKLAGHEDWQSAMLNIEEVMILVETHGIARVLLEFSEADFRLKESEVPDLSKTIAIETPMKLELGMILPRKSSSRQIGERLGQLLIEHGHAVRFLIDGGERQAWIDGDSG
jgi:hypothetical protein